VDVACDCSKRCILSDTWEPVACPTDCDQPQTDKQFTKNITRDAHIGGLSCEEVAETLDQVYDTDSTAQNITYSTNVDNNKVVKTKGTCDATKPCCDANEGTHYSAWTYTPLDSVNWTGWNDTTSVPDTCGRTYTRSRQYDLEVCKLPGGTTVNPTVQDTRTSLPCCDPDNTKHYTWSSSNNWDGNTQPPCGQTYTRTRIYHENTVCTKSTDHKDENDVESITAKPCCTEANLLEWTYTPDTDVNKNWTGWNDNTINPACGTTYKRTRSYDTTNCEMPVDINETETQTRQNTNHNACPTDCVVELNEATFEACAPNCGDTRYQTRTWIVATGDQNGGDNCATAFAAAATKADGEVSETDLRSPLSTGTIFTTNIPCAAVTCCTDNHTTYKFTANFDNNTNASQTINKTQWINDASITLGNYSFTKYQWDNDSMPTHTTAGKIILSATYNNTNCTVNVNHTKIPSGYTIERQVNVHDPINCSLSPGNWNPTSCPSCYDANTNTKQTRTWTVAQRNQYGGSNCDTKFNSLKDSNEELQSGSLIRNTTFTTERTCSDIKPCCKSDVPSHWDISGHEYKKISPWNNSSMLTSDHSNATEAEYNTPPCNTRVIKIANYKKSNACTGGADRRASSVVGSINNNNKSCCGDDHTIYRFTANFDNNTSQTIYINKKRWSNNPITIKFDRVNNYSFTKNQWNNNRMPTHTTAGNITLSAKYDGNTRCSSAGNNHTLISDVTRTVNRHAPIDCELEKMHNGNWTTCTPDCGNDRKRFRRWKIKTQARYDGTSCTQVLNNTKYNEEQLLSKFRGPNSIDTNGTNFEFDTQKPCASISCDCQIKHKKNIWTCSPCKGEGSTNLNKRTYTITRHPKANGKTCLQAFNKIKGYDENRDTPIGLPSYSEWPEDWIQLRDNDKVQGVAEFDTMQDCDIKPCCGASHYTYSYANGTPTDWNGRDQPATCGTTYTRTRTYNTKDCTLPHGTNNNPVTETKTNDDVCFVSSISKSLRASPYPIPNYRKNRILDIEVNDINSTSCTIIATNPVSAVISVYIRINGKSKEIRFKQAGGGLLGTEIVHGTRGSFEITSLTPNTIYTIEFQTVSLGVTGYNTTFEVKFKTAVH
jgi:hypothetical protein